MCNVYTITVQKLFISVISIYIKQVQIFVQASLTKGAWQAQVIHTTGIPVRGLGCRPH